MNLAPTNITLAILAGGEGSRMGHPKGESRVRGQPILTYLLDRFRWAGPTLLVTAPGREHPPGWETFSREVCDPVSGEGPLRGILTALETSETQWIIVTTVDMPEVGVEQFSFLAAGVTLRAASLGAMLRSPIDPSRIEPFPFICNREACALFRDHLAMGKRSVHSLTGFDEIVSIDWPAEWSENVWTNLNRVEELEAWLRR